MNIRFGHLLLVVFAAFLIAAGVMLYRDFGPEPAHPPRPVTTVGVVTPQGAPAPPKSAELKLTLRLLDADSGKPIADARGSVHGTAPGGAIPRSTFHTDDNGQADLVLASKDITTFIVHFRADGYPAYQLVWDTAHPVPDHYDLKIHAAVEVGGIVSNEAGEPVAGAKVVANMPLSAAERNSVERLLWESTPSQTTDEDGHWKCNHLPASFDASLTIAITHPEYLKTTFTTFETASGATRLRGADLLAGKASLVIKSLITVPGRVVDTSGKPVPEVNITVSGRSAQAAPAFTDEKGEFHVRGLSPGTQTATFQADKYAVEFTTFNAVTNMAPLEIVLKPGKTVKGRVVDVSGKPVPFAHIQAGASGARGRGAVVSRVTATGARAGRAGAAAARGGGGGVPLGGFDLDLYTDEEGRFQWNSSPEDGVSVSISKDEFETLGNFTLRPGAEEQVITLQAQRFATVKVLDAQTKAPITKFALTHTTQLIRAQGGMSTTSNRTNVNSAPNGTLKVPLAPSAAFANMASSQPDSTLAYVLTVEADGYYPQSAEPITNETGDITRTFALKKGEITIGKVVGQDGKPVAGAQITTRSTGAQAGPRGARGARSGAAPLAVGGSVSMRINQVLTRPVGGAASLAVGGSASVTSDAGGEFRLPPRTDVTEVIASQDQGGYAEVSMDEFTRTKTIKLQPWGQVEGVVRSHGKPAANVQVNLNPTPRPNNAGQFIGGPVRSYNSRTDADGKFVFQKVAPGDFSLYRLVQQSNGNLSVGGQRVTVTVKSGETAKVELGGNESDVTGKVVLDPPVDHMDWTRITVFLNRKPPVPPAGMSMQQWIQSPEYRNAIQNMGGSSTSPISADGTFRLSEVAPGDYNLSFGTMGGFNINSPAAGAAAPLQVQLNSTQEVHVPAQPDPSGLVDLGEIKAFAFRQSSAENGNVLR